MLFRLLRWGCWLFARVVLAGRYKVRVVGEDEVFQFPGPYLILPNHPAFLDPPLAMAQLWPAFRFRPMLLESNFRSPFLAPLVPILGAIKVPDIDRASAEARQQAEAAVNQAIEALKRGENIGL